MLCLVLLVRALSSWHDKSQQTAAAAHVNAALLSIIVDHGGFAVACWQQRGGSNIQPVLQGAALSAVALCYSVANAAASFRQTESTPNQE